MMNQCCSLFFNRTIFYYNLQKLVWHTYHVIVIMYLRYPDISPKANFTENVILGGVIHNAGQFFGEMAFGEMYRNRI
jgi:hypothetical protein